MGVKSTVSLPRTEVIARIVKHRAVIAARNLIDRSDEYLEDELEYLNDKVSGGEGFENYLIQD